MPFCDWSFCLSFNISSFELRIPTKKHGIDEGNYSLRCLLLSLCCVEWISMTTALVFRLKTSFVLAVLLSSTRAPFGVKTWNFMAAIATFEDVKLVYYVRPFYTRLFYFFSFTLRYGTTATGKQANSLCIFEVSSRTRIGQVCHTHICGFPLIIADWYGHAVSREKNSTCKCT